MGEIRRLGGENPARWPLDEGPESSPRFRRRHLDRKFSFFGTRDLTAIVERIADRRRDYASTSSFFGTGCPLADRHPLRGVYFLARLVARLGIGVFDGRSADRRYRRRPDQSCGCC